MKLAVQQENLKKALAQVSRAVPGKAVMPILSNVLLTTDQGRLRLSATDLNLAITVWAGAQIEQDGSVLVPAGLFADLVAGLPNDRVTLEVNRDNQVVTVACARFSTQINGAAAEEFPTVSATPPEGAPQVSFTAATLKEAIHQVACAAADTDTRPVLAGVYVRLHESTATLAAADGFRLALKQIALPAPVAAKQEVIIPAPALRELGGLLGDTTESISMSLVAAAAGSTTATQAIFTTTGFTLTTRLIDGQYPDVERILPKGCTTRAILDVRELNRAVKLAGLIASVSQNVVKLSVSAGEATQAGHGPAQRQRRRHRREHRLGRGPGRRRGRPDRPQRQVSRRGADRHRHATGRFRDGHRPGAGRAAAGRPERLRPPDHADGAALAPRRQPATSNTTNPGEASPRRGSLHHEEDDDALQARDHA